MSNELFNQLKQSLEECIMIEKGMSDTEFLVGENNSTDIIEELMNLFSNADGDDHGYFLYSTALYIRHLRTRLSGEKMHNAELIKHNKDFLREIG